MKVLRALNAGSERILSPRLLVVDAALEPTVARKIFREGLPSQARNEIWLVNLQGIPVPRHASAFDLIYLNEESRVLHAVEISQDNQGEPFKGQPTSALILPPKTIARSRTFTGDRIAIDHIENQSSEYLPVSSASPAAQPSSRSATPSKPKISRVPSNSEQKTRSTTAPASSRLTRGASLPLAKSSIVRASNPPAAAKGAELEFIKPSLPPEPKASAPTVTSAAQDFSIGPRRSIAPIPLDFTPRVPEETSGEPEFYFEPMRTIAPTPRTSLTPSVPAPVATEVPLKIEQPLVGHSFPASKVELEPIKSPVPKPVRPESQPRTPEKTSKHRVKRRDQKRESSSPAPDLDAGDGLERLLKKIKSWLSPAEKKSQPKMRLAPRINAPGLVGYYFAGGPSIPHEIRNISALGFYMVTDQRWMLGTAIRVTLQRAGIDAADPTGITVFARVVRWDSDGGGFEFIFPERKK